MGVEVATVEDRPTKWQKRPWKRLIVIVLLLGLALDFVCYQLYGVGLIFGKVLTIDIEFDARLR
jgi:hypothetical protein